tara:strand:- start:10704 stop:11096 length:393 start_codon:yes stop_codon:yes gene_type:complete
MDFQLESQSIDFSFYPLKKGRSREDKRIGLTVAKLLNDVLQSDPKSIVTFICDNTDKKAKKRLKLFKRWFKAHNEDKIALLIEFDDLFYAGVILCKNHPELDDIKTYLKEERIHFKKEKGKDVFKWDKIE